VVRAAPKPPQVTSARALNGGNNTLSAAEREKDLLKNAHTAA